MVETINVESVLWHLPLYVFLLLDQVPQCTWTRCSRHTTCHTHDDCRVITWQGGRDTRWAWARARARAPARIVHPGRHVDDLQNKMCLLLCKQTRDTLGSSYVIWTRQLHKCTAHCQYEHRFPSIRYHNCLAVSRKSICTQDSPSYVQELILRRGTDNLWSLDFTQWALGVRVRIISDIRGIAELCNDYPWGYEYDSRHDGFEDDPLYGRLSMYYLQLLGYEQIAYLIACTVDASVWWVTYEKIIVAFWVHIILIEYSDVLGAIWNVELR